MSASGTYVQHVPAASSLKCFGVGQGRDALVCFWSGDGGGGNDNPAPLPCTEFAVAHIHRMRCFLCRFHIQCTSNPIWCSSLTPNTNWLSCYETCWQLSCLLSHVHVKGIGLLWDLLAASLGSKSSCCFCCRCHWYLPTNQPTTPLSLISLIPPDRDPQPQPTCSVRRELTGLTAVPHVQ